MSFATADLYDAHGAELGVVLPMFRDYGGRTDFYGQISTVKAFEDNTLVRAALEEPGEGKVLVVDAGGSMRCAMLGDMLAELGIKNGWAGVVVYGCIRDSAPIGKMDIGVKALDTIPKKSEKRNQGQRDISVHFADVSFTPGHWLYADSDGIVVSAGKLL